MKYNVKIKTDSITIGDILFPKNTISIIIPFFFQNINNKSCVIERINNIPKNYKIKNLRYEYQEGEEKTNTEEKTINFPYTYKNKEILYIKFETQSKKSLSISFEFEFKIGEESIKEKIKITSKNINNNNNWHVEQIITKCLWASVSLILYFLLVIIFIIDSFLFDKGWIGIALSFIIGLLGVDLFHFIKNFKDIKFHIDKIIKPYNHFNSYKYNILNKKITAFLILLTIIIALIISFLHYPIKLKYNNSFAYIYNGIIYPNLTIYRKNINDVKIVPIKHTHNANNIVIGYVKNDYLKPLLVFDTFKYRPSCYYSEGEIKLTIDDIIINRKKNLINEMLYRTLFNNDTSLYYISNEKCFCKKNSIYFSIHNHSIEAKIGFFNYKYFDNNDEDIAKILNTLNPNNSSNHYIIGDKLINDFLLKYIINYNEFRLLLNRENELDENGVMKLYKNIMYNGINPNTNRQQFYLQGTREIFNRLLSIYAIVNIFRETINLDNFDYNIIYKDFNDYIKRNNGYAKTDYRVLYMFAKVISTIQSEKFYINNSIDFTERIIKLNKISEKSLNKNEKGKRTLFMWYLYYQYFKNHIYLNKSREQLFKPYFKKFKSLPEFKDFNMIRSENDTITDMYSKLIYNEFS